MSSPAAQKNLLIVAIVIFMASAACLAPGGAATVAQTQTAVAELAQANQAATATQRALFQTASAMPTLRPTNTPLPTFTSTPTPTDTPTITPTPTLTETPTPTPVAICASVDCRAPDFNLAGLDGNPIALSELRGRYVVLNFWATWCPPCRKETPDLVKAYNNFKDQNVIFIGISVDQSDSIKKVPGFVKQYKIPYPVATSLGTPTDMDYAINYLPTTFFIDKDGIIQDKVEQALTYDEIEAKIQRLLQNP